MTKRKPWWLFTALLALAGCGGGEQETWQEDPDLISDAGTTNMVSIPAGEAIVGVRYPKVAQQIRKDPTIPRRRKRKALARKKKFAAFQIDKYEVTLGNYYKFLQTLDPETRKKFRPRHHILGQPHPYWRRGHYKKGKGNFPVTGIPYEAAEAYARWRGKRLPDEFEWEYAARGPDGDYWAGGNRFDPNRYNLADRWPGEPKLMAINDPRQQGDVSHFGVRLMGGNASEWCSTKETRQYNILDEQGRIIKGKRKIVRLRAIRGPNFRTTADPLHCLLSNQDYPNPVSKLRQDKYRLTVGFRCAK